ETYEPEASATDCEPEASATDCEPEASATEKQVASPSLTLPAPVIVAHAPGLPGCGRLLFVPSYWEGLDVHVQPAEPVTDVVNPLAELELAAQPQLVRRHHHLGAGHVPQKFPKVLPQVFGRWDFLAFLRAARQICAVLRKAKDNGRRLIMFFGIDVVG